MPYIKPDKVQSPKHDMTLERVLIAGAGERETSYALQLWHRPDQPRQYSIGIRWNGDDNAPNGTPNISGHACWFVLDRRLWPAVLAMVERPEDRDYATEKLYGGGNGIEPSDVALLQP